MGFGGILHASFLVADQEASRAFYEDVLGLEPDPGRPEMGFSGIWYTLESGQQIHLLQLPNPDAQTTRPEHGGHDRHVAFSVDDLGALSTRLTRSGIPYSLSRSGRRALFCRDPDGNALECVES